MRNLILSTFLLVYYSNFYSQSELDQTEIITQVCKIYEKENIRIYNNLDNDIYEYELYLLKDNEKNTESDILKVFKISYKELKKLIHKTDNKKINHFYSTKTSKNLKDKNIAVLGIPIISNEGNSAVIFARYSCGIFCGKTTLFNFTKTDNSWRLNEFREIN